MTVPSPWLFQRIVEEMPEAVIVSDRAGVIVFWNRAAEVMFGHSAAEAVGQSLDLIIPERYRALHWAGYRTVMSTGVTRDDCPMGTRAGIPNRAWTGNDSGHPAGHGVRLVGRPIRVGDCVRLSDGRTGRVRARGTCE